MDDRPDTSDTKVVRPPRQRGWTSTFARRALRSNVAFGAMSSIVASYLRLVWATSRLTSEPTSSEVLFDENAPLIATSWHAEAFLLPFLRPRARHVDVMVSRTDDGEVMGRALNKLGCGTVRGSGTLEPGRMFEKGGVAALRALKASLDAGHSVLMTADYGPLTRGRASLGLVVLARLSGRPVVPLAVATHRHRRLGSWDSTALNLPFSPAAFVYADPVFVPPRADAELLEAKRLEIERSLVAVTARAYELAGRG